MNRLFKNADQGHNQASIAVGLSSAREAKSLEFRAMHKRGICEAGFGESGCKFAFSCPL